MRQFVKLQRKELEQLDLAIDQSMAHGDDVAIVLNANETIILQFDAITGIITGWIEDQEFLEYK